MEESNEIRQNSCDWGGAARVGKRRRRWQRWRRTSWSASPGRISRKSAGRPTRPRSRPRSLPPGAKYISADAQANPTKQLADVESLISKGANVLIILAKDSDAILPAVKKATDEGIPVIAYDRLIESPTVLYITFDNVGVGRMMAKAILEGQARRQLRLHQGRQGRSERRLPVLGHHRSAEAGDGLGQDQERRRDLHRRLEARQRPEGNGAAPDQEQQQGRCGRGRERRHGGRRRCGAHGAGSRRRRAGFRPGRRPCGDQPHRARHPDRLDLEGQRAISARSPAKPRSSSPRARR